CRMARDFSLSAISQSFFKGICHQAEARIVADAEAHGRRHDDLGDNLASTNATACCSLMVLPRFSRCARASAGESLNRMTFPSTTAVAYMASNYPKSLAETSGACAHFKSKCANVG